MPSNSFSLSKRFTPSNVFSDSLHFTSSNDFSKSGTFAPVVIIDRDESNTGGKLKPGAIAGIAVGAAAAVAIIAAIAFFFIKRHRAMLPNEEDVETLDDNTQSTTNDNPIYKVDGEDDPFKEDFE